MFTMVNSKYSYDYIGYLNSDILIHPGIFSVLDTVSEAVRIGKFPPSYILASRVGNSKMRIKMGEACNVPKDCLNAFTRYRRYSKMRTPTSAVCISFLDYE